MQRSLIQVPESFQAFGRWQLEGEDGRRWLAALPDLIADQCARWSLRVDGEHRHGYNGLAVPVLRDGEPPILKVGWPDQHVEEQVEALRVWDGRGSVRLAAPDSAASALLLERLDDRRSLADLPLRQAVPIIGALLRRLAIPAPVGHCFRTTTELAAELNESIERHWEATGRPFSRQILDAVVGLARDLSAAAPVVMVDSDLHYDQVLGGQREPLLVVDPLVLVGDVEHQYGQLLWTRFDEMADGPRIRWCLDALIDAAGLDPACARAWAVLRLADYRVWDLANGFTEDPVCCQRILELLL